MWDRVEARIEENEHEQAIPLRQEIFSEIQDSGLRPGAGATKKMVSFEFGSDDRIVWEIEAPAQNFYLHHRWQERVQAAGFTCKPRRYQKGTNNDGARHSGLSREWSFGKDDCVQVKVETAASFRRLIDFIQSEGDKLHLDPAAVTRWIARLREFFPDLDRFDRPDPDFDSTERAYKLETCRNLRAALESAANDHASVEAILAAIAKSNVLDWHTYLPLTPKGNADRVRLDPALSTLSRAALGPIEGHPAALEAFATAWKDAVPKGSDDAARQIAEFLFMHLWPDGGIYIRHSVREDLWREATGRRFPVHTSLADTYTDELKFMRAVRQAFEGRGLGPRDMIDIQSALWVVHNYSDDDKGAIQMDFNRDTIEAAMDAFDRHRETNENNEIFDHFGEPQEYWVRSSRERQAPVYPTKPLVGFILTRTELNGGWAQKGDAAARLHNAGFIIVKQDNTPVSPPASYDHLIRDADRIRLCALNYFIEPARERGASEVSIRASELARAMGLQNAFPNICSALGGKKFQEIARVAAPTSTEPNPSSSTIFTYNLRPKQELTTVAEATSAPVLSATNLILYGPPGTGKTYATAAEAVKLCDKLSAQDPILTEIGLRRELMARYALLVEEQRIEFVTFHQSFSYEEFVEGLRPTTSADDDQELDDPTTITDESSPGFRLVPRSGVFKAICDRARRDSGDSGSPRLDRSRAIFKIALGTRGDQEYRIREGLDKGLIHLGWGGDIDWSDPRFDEFEAIRAEWVNTRDASATGKDANIEQTFAFRSNLRVGDYVALSDGRDIFRAFGRVTGEYFFDKGSEFHPHRRTVDWIWQDSVGKPRSAFYPSNFRRHSCYKLRPRAIDWDSLEQIVLGTDPMRPPKGARDYVLIIDEINRANISKVFGELITLLEPDKRLGQPNEIRLKLPYSGVRFGVPANLHIIGTMNTADRSIALLDTALRRRFMFQEMMPNASILGTSVGGINMQKLLTTINDRIEYLFDREHQIGHAYFTSCTTREDVQEVMRYRVIPLLAEYFYEDWSKVAAVLGDAGQGKQRFLEARPLAPPSGLTDDGSAGEKLRWRVKATFDFSEFEG